MSSTKDSARTDKALNDLPELPTGLINLPKIIILKPGQTKVNHRCPKTKMSTVIDLHESGFRAANNTMAEFECDCGQIFSKPKG